MRHTIRRYVKAALTAIEAELMAQARRSRATKGFAARLSLGFTHGAGSLFPSLMRHNRNWVICAGPDLAVAHLDRRAAAPATPGHRIQPVRQRIQAAGCRRSADTSLGR